MKVRELWIKEDPDKLIYRLVNDFFHPYEQWGRLNRNQFLTGLACTIGYFLTNIVLRTLDMSWNPFAHSSNGLIVGAFICFGLVTYNVVKLGTDKFPWYETYMPKIITLLGLITLIALQNINGKGFDDIAILINIICLLTVFIIAAGYFVEGSSNEKTVKKWFSLFGYYFSVVVFFYFWETVLFK